MTKPKFQSSSPRPVDHGRDQVVGDQFAGGHAAPDLGAQVSVVLDVPVEDVTDVDVLKVKGSARSLAWVPFPLPWTPMMMYLRIPVTCLRAPERGVVAGDWFNHATGTTGLG